MGKLKQEQIIIGLIIGVLALGIGTNWTFKLGNTTTTTNPVGGGTTTQPIVVKSTNCPYTPTLTFKGFDKYVPGSPLATPSVLYKLNGGPITQSAINTAISLSKGDKVEYLINSSLYTDARGSYTMDCGAQTVNGEMLNALDQLADLTINVWNEDDGDLNSATNTQPLTNNDVKQLDIRLTPANKKGGKDCIMSFDYNITTYDKVEFVGMAVAITPTYETASNTANTVRSFALKAADGGNVIENSEVLKGKVLIDVKDTDPSGIGSRIFYDVNCADYYVDDNKGTFEYGLEDENGVETVDGTFDTLTGIIYVG
jgi:hypothetical protein